MVVVGVPTCAVRNSATTASRARSPRRNGRARTQSPPVFHSPFSKCAGVTVLTRALPRSPSRAAMAPSAVRNAARTALGAIAAREGFRGKAVLRTVTPAHFENGEWNTGGDCVCTHSFRHGERALGTVEVEYHCAQVGNQDFVQTAC